MPQGAIRLSLLLLGAAALAASSSSFPHFEQCDPRWGNSTIGLPSKPQDDSTICRVGCAMSSLAMLLAGLQVPGNRLRPLRPVDPGTLNRWLALNGGYDCVHVGPQGIDLVCFDLVSASVRGLTPLITYDGLISPPSLQEIQRGLTPRHRGDLTTAPSGYIAHVHNSSHFVLTVGVDLPSQSITVLDPFYNTNSYPYANVSGFLAFSLHRSSWNASGDEFVPFSYPTFKQCDARWGNHTIETTTVCQVGCLMSSISMALAGHGIDVGGLPADPGSLNSWLRDNSGYDQQNDLQEGKIANVSTLLPEGSVVWPVDGMHHTNDVEFGTLKRYLAMEPPRVVIANVLHGRHFVLVVGTMGSDTLLVNDPGFATTNYSYLTDVVGWRIFDMN